MAGALPSVFLTSKKSAHFRHSERSEESSQTKKASPSPLRERARVRVNWLKFQNRHSMLDTESSGFFISFKFKIDSRFRGNDGVACLSFIPLQPLILLSNAREPEARQAVIKVAQDYVPLSAG